MTTSTITTKGQTTIPVQIRDFLGLHSGDKLEFIPQEDGTVKMIPATLSITALKGMLPKPRKVVSIEAMNKAVRSRGSQST